jgi:Sec-independent protein translocase protein TatA
MLRILLYALLIWFLYNLIFRLIVPLYRTTRQVKQKFREMHQQMEDQNRQQQGYQKTNPTSKSASQTDRPAPSKAGGDYIDFEEIK